MIVNMTIEQNVLKLNEIKCYNYENSKQVTTYWNLGILGAYFL